MARLRIGVLGASSFAQRIIIPTIRNDPKFELAGVASRSLTSHPDFPIVPSYRDLVERDDVDAIYIPLPNSLHFEWITHCLAQGKHVLCEKSLCCSYAEVEQVTALARTNRLVLMENFHFRFHPQLAFIKRSIANGLLGEVRCVRSYFGFPPFPDSDNIRYKKELGGGALLDAGAYPLRIMLELLGPTVQITASSLRIDAAKGIDISGSAHFVSDNADGLAAFGFDNQYQCSVEIWGSEGTLTSKRIFTAPPNLEVALILESKSAVSEQKIAPFNAYAACLQEFARMALYPEQQSVEVEQELTMNLLQAKLIESCRMKAVNLSQGLL